MTGRILQNGNTLEVKKGDSFTIIMKITKMFLGLIIIEI